MARTAPSKRPASLVGSLLLALLLVTAAVLAGCASGPDVPSDEVPAEEPAPTGSGFGSPELAGLCEDVTVDVAEDEPAAPTPADAIEELVRSNAVLADTTIEGTDIVYDGEVVGHVRIREAPGGGYYVETAEWCYPG